MASKKARKQKIEKTENENTFSVWRNAIRIWVQSRNAQFAIIKDAIADVKQTPEYQTLETEKKVAFGIMAFTIAFPLIALAVIAIIASFWRG